MTKPNSNLRTAHYHCAQMSYTTQHSSIFSINLHAVEHQMVFIGGEDWRG